MKSKERVDQEIKDIADLWNYTSPGKGVDHPANLIAGAVYDALRWARGMRVECPSDILIKRWKRIPKP